MSKNCRICYKISFLFLLSILVISLSGFQLSGNPQNWEIEDFIGFDEIGDCSFLAGDIASVFLKIEKENTIIRITFDDMIIRSDNKLINDNFSEIFLQFILLNNNDKRVFNSDIIDISAIKNSSNYYNILRTPEYNLLEISIKEDFSEFEKSELKLEVNILNNDEIVDSFITECSRNRRGGNCAFVHHGNQGLTYTEVFYGQFPQESSGFDEVLEVHQQYGLPGNFHMSGTLMPAAEWHNPEFNDWLSSGVQEGYVAMLTSAMGQHIMPFVQNEMNDWSVSTEFDMVQYMYDYIPKVAWIPERVWLATDHYPEAGVIDWLGDNWTQHGVEAVILDDAPHCDTGSNLKIHWMNNSSGVDLRVIPINNNFVGQMHYDADGAKNLINNTGQYGIAVYGTDWEVAAEMNEHYDEWFLENYQNVLGYCADNYPAINVWKLDAALDNADFNGEGLEITNGTYFLLGGYDGYGGSNNSWYTHWAGHPSQSDFHSPAWTYGYIWDDAYQNLMNCPNSYFSQLGWYTLMINLHETGWHDSGDISGWEHRYSSHMKNTNVYAAASRWANGEFTESIETYFDDIDRDGTDELIMHNESVMYVFESIGGRISWIFSKDENGNMFSLVGSDVAYYPETNGDYNESSNNHIGALSEVSPNYQHDIYEIEVLSNTDTVLEVKFTKDNLSKICELQADRKYLEVNYSYQNGNVYTKSGWTPDLLDIIWSGKSHLQRMWGDFGNYCGRRNSASGATTAYVLGNGGAEHNSEFEGTLVMGDEIQGNGNFKIFLYTGYTSEPYDEFYNKVVELDELAEILEDDISPSIVNNTAWFATENKVQIIFDEEVEENSAANIQNYTLSGFNGNYTIESVMLTHSRKITLFFQQNISEDETGTIIIQNITDLAGNEISDTGNEAELTQMIKPHLVGNFNSWDPENHDYELTLSDNGIWKGEFLFETGSYEYKVLETDDWTNDFPSENQSFETFSEQNVTFYVNSGVMPQSVNSDEYVFHSLNPPVVVGDFLSEIGGTDWNVESLLTQMNDQGDSADEIANDGTYTYQVILPSGNYEYKIVLNNNWDQNTTGDNLVLNLSNESEIIFYYDMSQNIISNAIQNTNAEEDQLDNINSIRIDKIYPNPFNPSTTIAFEVTDNYEDIVIEIFNIKGQIVKKFEIRDLNSGMNEIVWDGTDELDKAVPTGIYLFKLQSGKQVSTKKGILLK